MTQSFIIGLATRAMWVTLLIAAPILGFGLLTGVVISIFQAVTQIQEMTLTFIPKIIVVAMVLLIFGPWMLSILLSFTANLIMSIPTVVP